MAATPVYTTAISDQLGTLTLKLYDQAGVTVLNPGDTAAVDAAGRYTWSVSESLSGVKDYEVETAAGAKVAGGQVLLADTTEPQALDDVLGAASPIAELAQAAPVA